MDNSFILDPSRNQPLYPTTPVDLEASGLSEGVVSNLILKQLYHFSMLTGTEISDKLALPFSIIDPILNNQLLLMYIEKKGGIGLGNVMDRFSLTDRGRNYTRDLLSMDTYIGAAPVSLEDYTRYYRNLCKNKTHFSSEFLREAWKDYSIDEEYFMILGPAINSAKSCFVYGAPGTGKTTVAKQIALLINTYGGDIAIPHSIIVGGSIIRIYDPFYHKVASDDVQDPFWFNQNPFDRRWIICKRPIVISGGELTLDMLDLRYNQTTNYYEAPIQMKANGGVLIIDDFGRQFVKPKDLLNRWIVPLEERTDYLNLHTGLKFSVPFEQFNIFATNLDPKDLVDEAFLRRIRYKIAVGAPSLPIYKKIFAKECEKKNINYQESDLDILIDKYYRAKNRPLRACDPRDITDRIYDYCIYHEIPLDASAPVMEEIFASHLIDIH